MIRTGFAGQVSLRADGARPRTASARTQAARSRRLISATDEDRLPLLHEGAAALGVVLAVHALPEEGVDLRRVALPRRLDDLGDGPLRRLDGERRVLGDLRGDPAHLLLE